MDHFHYKIIFFGTSKNSDFGETGLAANLENNNDNLGAILQNIFSVNSAKLKVDKIFSKMLRFNGSNLASFSFIFCPFNILTAGMQTHDLKSS